MKETVCISGPCMYAKVFEHNRDREGFEGAYKAFGGAYLISVGVEDRGSDFKRILGWNRMYSPKIGGEDKGFELEKGAEEGKAYFTFKRKHEVRKKNGELILEWSGPPGIKDAEGNMWPENKLIGNGSVVDVWLDVEKPEGYKITFVRIRGIVVQKLVEFETAEQPSKEEPETKPTMEDDIPF